MAGIYVVKHFWFCSVPIFIMIYLWFHLFIELICILYQWFIMIKKGTEKPNLFLLCIYRPYVSGLHYRPQRVRAGPTGIWRRRSFSETASQKPLYCCTSFQKKQFTKQPLFPFPRTTTIWIVVQSELQWGIEWAQHWIASWYGC